MKRISILLFSLLLLVHNSAHNHGFAGTTPVRQCHKKFLNIQEFYTRGWCSTRAVSFDPKTKSVSCQKVAIGRKGQVNCHMRLCIEHNGVKDCIVCSPGQEFYAPLTRTWVEAYKLASGDMLLGADGYHKRVTSNELVKKQLAVYALQVPPFHTLCVGKHGIVAHNMAIPWINMALSVSYGTGTVAGAAGGSFFGPLGFAVGIGAGCGAGALVAWLIKKLTDEYKDSYVTKDLEAYIQKRIVAKQWQRVYDGTVLSPPEEPISIACFPDPQEAQPWGCGQPPSLPVETECNFSKTQPKPTPIIIEPFQEPPGLRPPGCGQPTLPEGFPGCRYPGVPSDVGPLFHAQEVERPHGTYEGVGYHHPGSKGEKSPAPDDGQAALDDSVEVEGDKKRRRVALEGDRFVVLSPTNPHGPGAPVYHGHATDWAGLHKDLQKAFISAGLTNHKGKILK